MAAQKQSPYSLEELATIIGFKEIAIYELQKDLREVSEELRKLKNEKTPGTPPEKKE